MKKSIQYVSASLAAFLLLGSFAACNPAGKNPDDDTSGISSTSESVTEIIENSDSTSEKETETVKEVEDSSDKDSSTEAIDGGSESESNFESRTEDTTENVEDTTENVENTTVSKTEASEFETRETESASSSPRLEGQHAALIENADSLKNGVTAYYTDGNRNQVVFENMEMMLNYAISSRADQQVTSLTSKNGNAYITDSMDVFVRMNDGGTYYAKDSYTSSVFNIHRFGYYYYEMKLEGQSFIGDLSSLESYQIDLATVSQGNELSRIRYRDGILNLKNNADATDPYLVLGSDLWLDTSKYTVLEITMKADSKTANKVDVYYVAGEKTGSSSSQMLRFTLVADGEYHTYRIPLYTGTDYTGQLKRIRLDVSGKSATYEISEAKILALDIKNSPAELSLSRTFNVYSDKMHHTIQVAATAETNNIKEIGMVTRIDADTVDKVVLEDKNGIRYTFDGADWESVEYVGFDIKNAGIFGYILPFDGKGGSIKVELVDGVYVIEQALSPEGGTIKPSRTTYNDEKKYYDWVLGGNSNDFYMGQRIYTDESHDFAEFLYEAYCERNPLKDQRLHVYPLRSNDASYAGYDSLRGIYAFNMEGTTSFNQPYYSSPNKHYRTSFGIAGDNVDRKIYVMTYTSSGFLECAALLDENDVMLPVSLEVGKNFSEQYGERNLFNLADFTYGEVIMPLVIEKGGKYNYTVLNLYQNWGNFPLKQISWIQYFSPYYHLSTGVTETNCITPWTFTNQTWYNTLPDFRGMSAPLWTDQPQHTSCCDHDWLRYVDESGAVIRSENVQNVIDSYGPTYSDVRMDYVTYDGKIKISYTHTEMPQTDENRTYYEIKYEVLSDVTIKDVVNNLQLYKVNSNDSTGTYQKVGYLNEDNTPTVVAANKSADPQKYTLGKNCPYFSFFDMDDWSTKTGYGNFGFLIYNYSFVIGGKKAEPSFAIVNYSDAIYLTLDLDELTLKAGDSFEINCILLPWGSQTLEDGIINAETNNFEYTMVLDGEEYMDKNVRLVRENTLLNPIFVTAHEGAEAMESVFVPKLKTTNGISAEFTLSGGYNNTAVRIYGFEKSTVPAILEKIGEEWVKYDVSSQNAEKDPHKYDGYCVHYDGDGSFSYSFVVAMDGKTDRTFKIVADGNYTPWEAEEVTDNAREDLLSIYADPVEIAAGGETMISKNYISSFEIMEEESYIRLFGPGDAKSNTYSYTTVYKPATPDTASGKYLAIKYRLPSTNKENPSSFRFFISTVISAPSNDSCCITGKNLVSDGEWHVMIFDLEKVTKENFMTHFVADASGNYYPQFIRIDFFDTFMSPESCIDIAFIGMDSELSKIVELSRDTSTIIIYENGVKNDIDPSTGEIIDNTVYLPEVLVDPSSGYTHASLEYGAQMDYLNGTKISILGGSKASTVGYRFNGTTIADRSVTDSATVSGSHLVMSGWCVVEGGIDRYVWSADGGKTWYEVEQYGRKPSAAGESTINVAYARSNKTYEFSVDADSANGNFQGKSGNNPTGISANLSSYAGNTVNVIFGAVPSKDTGSILPLFYFEGVTVPASN